MEEARIRERIQQKTVLEITDSNDYSEYQHTIVKSNFYENTYLVIYHDDEGTLIAEEYEEDKLLAEHPNISKHHLKKL